MHRSALVAMKPGASNQELLTFSVSLAKKHSLLLVGETVFDRDLIAGVESVPLGASAFKVERDEKLLHQAIAQVSEARAAFAAACEPAGIPFEFHEVHGQVGANLTVSAHRYDLVILGRHAQENEVSALESILRHCPRPAVVVATAAEARGPVLVAYDGSPQAARALASFVASGLLADEPVSVVTVETATGTGHGTSRLAADYLLRHGRRVQSRVEQSRVTVAEAILGCADDLRPGLIVMGAFGQPTIREFLLGSVTKELLRRLTAPIWIDH